ncbi:MAG: prepilin-type N-terminal cleavage/methylation domain-containing protein [Magnetococcales bacterium]|nr:prepilin-type N-terminal cleavage/methylation domain-containing protein [Magnetococcales bacterium]
MSIRPKNRSEAGFTLIELVMVIVILGILSAVATPKFTSLVDEAEKSAIKGIAGALSSASSTNWAACKSGASTGCVNSTSLLGCATAGLLIDSEEADALFTATGHKYALSTETWGALNSLSCTITGPNSITAKFTMLKP